MKPSNMVQAESFPMCLRMYVAQVTPLCTPNKVHPKSETRVSPSLERAQPTSLQKPRGKMISLQHAQLSGGLRVHIFSKHTHLPTLCIYRILLGSFSGSPLAAIAPTPHLCVRVSHNYFSGSLLNTGVQMRWPCLWIHQECALPSTLLNILPTITCTKSSKFKKILFLYSLKCNITLIFFQCFFSLW